ncbi:glycoside hydrolase family 43 protein [Hymenobacter weizhouensis]|uniref:glycoside hydrolase family 43 protein n=1 Tax=Hymenobacter sp. YIM 151500-1 TaxID=2987689 RepID=UPI0022271136|nr:glycoside hydrolase family 43 protein [Hymenobacter sp. YIM 151500-1]UYZ62091.1 glycoside hydrolase family 43 protein [Hymenobacter sp. YIM 151500-1]
MKLALFRTLLPALLLGLWACKKDSQPYIPSAPPATETTTYRNPLLASGADPWVTEKDGFYYYMHTTGNNLTLWKTAKMSELGSAPSKVIWTPPASGPTSRDIWAPEIRFLDGKWYVYFTAGPGGCCAGQRMWVLENSAADPTTGTWVDRGQLTVPGQDLWAIDATILEQNGKRYVLWSGQEPNSVEQRLYIAQLSNPWTIVGPRVQLSRPEFGWETIGDPDVNEGPQVLKRGSKTFIVYSASHCSSDDYALGMLTASSTADPMNVASWTKSSVPVFTKDPADRAFGPGHNSFFKSKNGQEDWILYHANANAGQGCGGARSPRMQKFSWNADDTPNFGDPAPLGTALPEPGGE